MNAATKGKGAELARLAAMLCQQPEFMTFAGCTSAEDAAAFVRRTCGIQSRRELDHDPRAAKLFHDRVRRPYVQARGMQ